MNDGQHRFWAPGKFLVGLILALSVLLAIYWFGAFGVARLDARIISWSVRLVAVVLGIEFVVFCAGLVLKRPRQYGVRWLLLLTLAIAIPTSMYAHQTSYRQGRERALKQLMEIESRILKGKPDRRLRGYRKTALTITSVATEKQLTGIRFAIEEDIGCGCCYDNAGTDVCDTELSTLAYFPQLEHLDLADGAITDAGLRHLKSLKHLKTLNLSGNSVTDAGLAYLGELVELRELTLDGTLLTDRGLVHFRNLQKLERLSLNKTGVTDNGFSVLGELTSLKSIECRGTQVDGSGVQHLVPCTKLEALSQDAISAVSLNRCVSLSGLRFVNANVSRPSAALDIKLTNHNQLSEVILSAGQTIRMVRLANLPALASAHFSIAACPHDRTRLGDPLSCGQCSQDIGGLQLENLPQLTSLALHYVPNFEISASPSIRHLQLWGLDSAKTFSRIQQIPQLQTLSISCDQFSNPQAFLAIGSLPRLEKLSIYGKGLTDESLAMLKGFPKLKSLSLPDGGFTGRGLQHLQGLESLEELTIQSVRDPGEPLACLSGLSRLKSLRIEAGEIGQLKLVGLSRLDQLSMNADCEALHLERLPGIRWLHFNSSKTLRRLTVIDLASLVHLAAGGHDRVSIEHVHFEDLPALKELKIGNSIPNPHLTDASYEHVASFRNLEELELSKTSVTEKTLDQLKDLTKLRRVYLYDTPVDAAAAKKLESNSAAPQLRVFYRW